MSDAVWRRVYEIAFGLARGHFRLDLPDAEEVGQEMMLRAIKQVGSAPINSTWIYNGVRFLCIDRVRARRSEAQAMERYTREWRTRLDLQRAAGSTAELTAAVASLAPECRELIRQYFWEGKTWAELDAHLGRGRRCSQYATGKCLKVLAKALGHAGD